MSEAATPQQTQSTEAELIAVRREKLAKLRELGVGLNIVSNLQGRESDIKRSYQFVVFACTPGGQRAGGTATGDD